MPCGGASAPYNEEERTGMGAWITRRADPVQPATCGRRLGGSETQEGQTFLSGIKSRPVCRPAPARPAAQLRRAAALVAAGKSSLVAGTDHPQAERSHR